MDNNRQSLIQGLQSDPKYFPFWYRYDKDGSEIWNRMLHESKYYYLRESEASAFAEYRKDSINKISKACALVDMGSGTSEKARQFIDVILEKQTRLKYIPVDISGDQLQEACTSLSQSYGDSVEIDAVPADYDVGIEHLGSVPENKLILWLSGFQNQPYQEQVLRLTKLSKVMTKNDVLLLTLDITQDAKTVENAYADPTGYSLPFYFNNFKRLNKEYGSDIDTNKFVLKAKFIKNMDVDSTSNVAVGAISTCDQTYNIPGLGITLSLKKGERIQMHEGEGTSCKYTEAQIRKMVKKGGLYLDKLWRSADNLYSVVSIQTSM